DVYDTVLGRPATALARTAAQVIDPVVIDGAVMGTAVAVRRTARELRQLQSGQVRRYALTVAVGLAAARGVDRTAAVWIAMLVALAELAGALVLAVGYDPTGAAFQNTAT